MFGLTPESSLSGISKTSRFDTPTEVVPATASSGLAAVSSCISKSMSHKLVDSLDFETRTSEADLPGEHLGEQAPAAYVGLATFTVNTYHTL